MQQETMQHIANVADKVTITSAGVSVVGAAAANYIAAYGGFIVGIIGVLVALIFKWLEYKEVKRHHRAVEYKRFSDLE